ncbi:MAG: hypothetical protein M1813_004559 [Trichoglossum hirsutum]|nr:MAG: hypothetical protein M1813_004559 [Trichoglossum hirsutum]
MPLLFARTSRFSVRPARTSPFTTTTARRFADAPAGASTTTTTPPSPSPSPAPAPAPVSKKPIGGFRGGPNPSEEAHLTNAHPAGARILGFLLGCTLTGSVFYYTVLADYKASNDLLSQDIYSLQSAVQKIEKYVQSLEEKVEAVERKKGK